MDDEHTADRILGRRWETYAQWELAHAGQDYPGRDKVVEIFGEPDPFDVVVAPFDHRWPGLATTPAMPRTDPEHLAAEVLDLLTDEDDEELGLLERACRSTDVPALAEQHGLADYWSSEVQDLCTVLQSWEERFGTRILALGQERLIVSVAAPASSMSEAEAIAAEHFAFSPDTITQGEHETLRAYAAHDVLGKQLWSFWWD